MAGAPPQMVSKRLILCCDGTWMNSDNGYEEPGWFESKGTLQVPSNVTRISRCFKRRCSDGKLQVISYESGVGTGSNGVDSLMGGAFGLGLSERVRETYSYLCSNYMDGDEIVLIGYSRGAFTARSVAGMVGNIGLLTREGVEFFYCIFKDMQNWQNPDYKDPFPDQPFSKKPKGPHAAAEYRARLEEMGFTRVKQANGDLIKIKAIGVWDTVGSLGIPDVSWLSKLDGNANLPSTYMWHDTSLSDRIENAFQALALDETRPPFSPAVWERPGKDQQTNLKQVWFPGNHANVGGGWEDQGAANCTLAWMMDQLASVGVEFDENSIDRYFKQTSLYYQTLGAREQSDRAKAGLKWAVDPIYDTNSPLRPWGLGQICKKVSLLYWFSGQITRSPGLYHEHDPETEERKARFLQDTNERIHSSVRIRLACKGLDLNDKAVWACPALGKWRLKQGKPDSNAVSKQTQWVWEFSGGEKEANPDKNQRVMREEPLGPYEQRLLELAAGKPNVWEFAEKNAGIQ
ncbi:unnamed protein product [Clonostachys byssicola]|uniref:T6SS Phospholipase effector Tle1-like catalytic domain-containing protein n=1 Tax=Clonostachys byssicola TaxID=160290 RepID=A0A9N9U3L1_9HYPO|nr:unnamed protein product [Clonostachys byssicola]